MSAHRQLQGHPGRPVIDRCPGQVTHRREYLVGGTAHRGAERADVDGQPGRLGHLDGRPHMRAGRTVGERFDGELGGDVQVPIMPR